MEPRGNQTILVHKDGEEGSIELDAHTGQILTPIDDRPDWADGLAVGLLAERQKFYRARLGEQYAAAHATPDAIVYQDLGWIGVDAEGDEVELEADADYRMDVVARVLGINREDYDSDKHFGDTAAEAEIAMDRDRSPAEAKLMDEGMEQTFGTSQEAEAGRKASGDGTD